MVKVSFPGKIIREKTTNKRDIYQRQTSSDDSIKIARSFIILHNSFFTELVKRETNLSVKTKTKISDQE
jgi:hypothetical protein